MINFKRLFKKLQILNTEDQTESIEISVDSSGNSEINTTGDLLINGDNLATDFIRETERGQPNGIAELDGTGKVPLAQLPDLGEDNTASNVGAGEGLFKEKNGADLVFKSLVAGTNVTLTPGTDTLTISSTDTGEVNTASNVGATGAEVFKQKSGVDLQFRKIKAGANVTVTQNADDIEIASTGGGGGGVNPNYITCLSSNILSTNTSSVAHDAWKDVTGATLTITPSGPNEQWEIYAKATIGIYYGGGAVYSNRRSNLRIVEDAGVNLGTLVDNADGLIWRSGSDALAGSYDETSSITLIGRVTISSAKTYKLQIKFKNDAAVANANNLTILFGSDSLETTPQFWAKRVY